MELLAYGRTAEVFAWGDGRVLKLDRLEWNGLASLEASALAMIRAAGVPAPRAHQELVVDERCGVVLDRIDGPLLSQVIAGEDGLDSLALRFSDLHCSLNEFVVAGLPDLVVGLADGIRSSGLALSVVHELLALIDDLDDGRRTLCHYDLHPGNVIVAQDRWAVIDWLTAASGPADADFARTLVLHPPGESSSTRRFMLEALRQGLQSRGLAMSRLEGWIRVVAGARLAEGFGGEHARTLTALASGDQRITELG